MKGEILYIHVPIQADVMKKKLIIKNIGPVRDVALEFRRFNFFIGPQSSGKSTIAKVFSTCNWVEKEVSTTLDEKAVKNADAFTALMVDFHKMDTYFHADSEIHYESDCVSIDLDGKAGLAVQIKENSEYHRQKICYIPAERNIATLPELQGFEFGTTNLRSFLFDWFNAREYYTAENKSEILNLGLRYYFDPNETKYKDRIEHDNGKTYRMPLGSASSGLQSVIPLYIMMQYYSGQYFEDFDQRSSFDLNVKTRKIRRRLLEEMVLKKMFPEYDDKNSDEWLDRAVAMMQAQNKEIISLYRDNVRALQRLTIPNRTCFIVEEPEQNLYPDTQTDLIENFVELCSKSRKHELTVTTHSPYILNLLNLLFKRHDVKMESAVGLDFDETMVYAVADGGVCELKLRNAHLVDPKYLSAPIDRIYAQYESI